MLIERFKSELKIVKYPNGTKRIYLNEFEIESVIKFTINEEVQSLPSVTIEILLSDYDISKAEDDTNAN